MYDPSNPMTVEGTVVEYQWLNPHVWVHLEFTAENGETQLWVLEAGSPNSLVRRGWAESSLSEGDRVTATFRRLKDGSRGGLLGRIELPGGGSLYDPY